jgi:hypothetical protein
MMIIQIEEVFRDADLASFYGVTTTSETQFRTIPKRFYYNLNIIDKKEVVAFCDHLKNLIYSKLLLYAYAVHFRLGIGF